MSIEQRVTSTTNNAAVDALFDEVAQLRADMNVLRGQVHKIGILSAKLAGIVDKVERVVKRGDA